MLYNKGCYFLKIWWCQYFPIHRLRYLFTTLLFICGQFVLLSSRKKRQSSKPVATFYSFIYIYMCVCVCVCVRACVCVRMCVCLCVCVCIDRKSHWLFLLNISQFYFYVDIFLQQSTKAKLSSSKVYKTDTSTYALPSQVAHTTHFP